MTSSFPTVSVMELMGTVDWVSVGQFLMSAVPVWLLGALIGLLLPRPRWLSLTTEKTSAFFATAEVGARLSVFGRLAMCFHGFMLVREIWFRFTSPGTFRRCCYALCQLLRGRGWNYPADDNPQQEDRAGNAGDKVNEDDVQWYIGEADLTFFLTRQETFVAAGPWEKILEKEIPGQLKYTAWRRSLPSRKTEYKSITVSADSSPNEVMDFYLNDPVRQRWDPLLTHTETLLDGRFSDRQQVVHWVRSFPFSFLSDRDYVIGRRIFERDDMLYGISKAVPFPSHSPGRLVTCDLYWSMWSHKVVPCPWNSGKVATETVLLHMEDFKIPENLSRFAVRHGMWGFVQKMLPACTAFIAERRASGVAPTEADPRAFGANPTGVPSATCATGGVACPPPRKSEDLRHSRSTSDLVLERPAPSTMKRVASAVVAGSMLIALGGLGRQQQLDLTAKRSRRPKRRTSATPGTPRSYPITAD